MRKILNPSEILEHDEIIFKIDSEILHEMNIERNESDSFHFTGAWHREKLSKIKDKLNVSNEESDAIESFYDIWFFKLTQLQVLGQVDIVMLVHLKSIVFNELQEIAISNIKEHLKDKDVNIYEL